MKCKSLVAVVVTLFMFASGVGVASAGWLRGFSDVNTSANDESLCEDEITISYKVSHTSSSFDFSFPDFVPEIGTSTYPGGQSTIDLYASAAEATTFGTPIVSVAVLPILTVDGSGGGSYIFEGEGVAATPAGYENGDSLYAWAYDGATLDLLAVELTIGDEIYGCEQAEPGELLAVLWPGYDAVKTFQYLPSAIAYYAPDIDHSTVEVSANDSTKVGTVTNVGTFWGIGVGTFKPQNAGVTCDTTSLDFTALTLRGEPLAGSIPVTVTERNCPSTAPAA